jgi:hypothetical protein
MEREGRRTPLGGARRTGCLEGEDSIVARLTRGKRARVVAITRLLVFAAVIALQLATSASPALATGDTNQAFCPNEALVGFQPALPDCRAYEQVSPTYKEGYPTQFAGVSPDGSTVLLESLGSFANAELDVLAANAYKVTRGADGWTASAIGPPAAIYPGVAAEGVWSTPDLKQTLWVMHTDSESSEATNLYLGNASGKFILIGRELPSSAYTLPPEPGQYRPPTSAPQILGASADLTHVVIKMEPRSYETPIAPAWPGDTTIRGRSLYEFVDTPGPEDTGSVEPKLVAVSNAGRLSSNTEAHLISQCGVMLGGANALFAESDEYNAVSASGESVFFTALARPEPTGCSQTGHTGTGPPVGELYARVAGATTVPISEPSLSVPGRECTGACEAQETNEVSRAPGLFQGASEDGSKVFFLTKQSLVNSDEGGAGEGEDLYEAVIAPGEHAAVTKLVEVSHDPNAGEKAEVQGVMRVSENGSHVYFVAHGVLETNENRQGEKALPGAENFYVYNTVTGTMTFIARLSERDGADWSHEDLRHVDATPDGRYIVFESAAHLTPDDIAGEAPQAFEYDSQTGLMARISVGATNAGPQYCPLTGQSEAGYNCNGLSNNEEDQPFFSRTFNLGDRPNQAESLAHVSADGATVTFASADGLSPQATNARAGFCPNIYEYHSVGPITSGGVNLISSGRDVVVQNEECGSLAIGTDASGADVFFAARDQLVPQDTDTQLDVYDARVGGGFPAALSSECAGEACQPTYQTQSGAVGQATSLLSGAGNIPPPPASPPAPAARRLTRAQQLRHALAGCRHLHKRERRRRCERAATKRYGARAASTTKTGSR